MFSSCLPHNQTILPEIPDFDSAGTLFTNETHVLAGYQKDIKNTMVSGIGGKREGLETYMETAIRETVEELFHVKHVPLVLIRKIILTVKPQDVGKNGSYILVIYNFNDLEKILKIVRRMLTSCPIYKKIPKTVIALILERKTRVKGAEIIHLCILPMIKNARLDIAFHEDVLMILADQFSSCSIQSPLSSQDPEPMSLIDPEQSQ